MELHHKLEKKEKSISESKREEILLFAEEQIFKRRDEYLEFSEFLPSNEEKTRMESKSLKKKFRVAMIINVHFVTGEITLRSWRRSFFPAFSRPVCEVCGNRPLGFVPIEASGRPPQNVIILSSNTPTFQNV